MIAMFCGYGYSLEIERFQSWCALYEVVYVLTAVGWVVHMVMDVGRFCHTPDHENLLHNKQGTNRRSR